MNSKSTQQLIAAELSQDIGNVDITTKLLIPPKRTANARIIANARGVMCGLPIAGQVFQKLDPRLKFSILIAEGGRIHPGQTVAKLQGNARAILTGERVALNFISHLSGISTKTAQFVAAARPYKAKIYDTRKTTPGLRSLEKLAVKTGGGHNHRFNLSEMIMVKDNHHLIYSEKTDLVQLIRSIRRKSGKRICIEADTLEQSREALASGCDIILLDNMNIGQLKAAVKLSQEIERTRRPLLEASGGIDLRNVRAVAQTGIDRILIGALTHSVAALDFSLEIVR